MVMVSPFLQEIILKEEHQEELSNNPSSNVVTYSPLLGLYIFIPF